MRKINLTEEQAHEMYYNINSYYLFLRSAESVDKLYFEKVKFWNPVMNQHLKRARESIGVLMSEFNKTFKAKDTDVVEYDAPAELMEVMTYFSRLHPEDINRIMNKIKKDELSR